MYESQGDEILRECSSHIMCHMSCVTCHVSRVKCHVSPVTCHLSHVIFLHLFFNIFLYKKSRIRETKHLLTEADSSTNTTVGCTNNTPKPDFFEKWKKSSKTQKPKNVQKYAKISDTPFDQRSLIHQEAKFPGQPKITKKPDFLEKRKKSFQTQKLKNIQKYAKICTIPFDQRSLIHQEAWFPPCFKRQNQPKKILFFCWAILDHFQTKMFKSETISFHQFSPRILNL